MAALLPYKGAFAASEPVQGWRFCRSRVQATKVGSIRSSRRVSSGAGRVQGTCTADWLLSAVVKLQGQVAMVLLCGGLCGAGIDTTRLLFPFL